MKPIKYIYLIIIFFSLNLNISAKDGEPVAGYMGKRFAIGYAPSFMPFPSSFNFIGTDGLPLSLTSLNIKHRFDLNYVVKENTAISLDYSFQKWGSFSNLDNNGYMPETNVEQAQFMQQEFGISDFQYVYCTSNKFTLGLITTKGIAPRGNYLTLGVSVEYITPHMVDTKGNTIDLETVNDIGGLLRFGKRRVFYDKFMVDASFSIEPNLSIFSKNSIGGYSYSSRRFDDGNSNYLSKDDIKNVVLREAGSHTLLSFRLGIYYLL